MFHVRRNAQQRALSLRSLKFANREEDERMEGVRKGRDEHDSSGNRNYADYPFMYIFISIYIFIVMYVRVRDQTLHCRLNKMKSHVNTLRT